MPSDRPPLPEPPSIELLDEDEMEALFIGMCQGDYQSVITLDHHQNHQFQAYALMKFAQLWLKLEQRTTA